MRKQVVLVLLISILYLNMATIATADTPEFSIPELSTPFQDAIKKGIENGSISPSIAPEFSVEVLEKTKNHIKLKGITNIKFRNPREAGYGNGKWPKFQVKDNPKTVGKLGEGIVKPGDYDQDVKDYLMLQIQNIQNDTERQQILSTFDESFEYGQRDHVIEETYEITYPENVSSSFTVTNSSDVLMGFTRGGSVSWWIEDRGTIWGFEIYYYKAGFDLNGVLGLRLPTNVTLNLPDVMIRGQAYDLSTAIDGVNWNGDKYANANVPSENGNEFVARLNLHLGTLVRIMRITVINWSYDTNRDYGKSFETPFGRDEEFPIPDLDLSPEETGLNFGWSGIATLGIGLIIDPNLGSETITADWSASGDSIGSGPIEYNEPNISYQFGPVRAGNYSGSTDYANVRISDFRYYFDICNVNTGANVQLRILGIDIPLIPYIHLLAVSCEDITDDLYLGVHRGTTADDVNGNVYVSSQGAAPRITMSPESGEYVAPDGTILVPIGEDAFDSIGLSVHYESFDAVDPYSISVVDNSDVMVYSDTGNLSTGDDLREIHWIVPRNMEYAYTITAEGWTHEDSRVTYIRHFAQIEPIPVSSLVLAGFAITGMLLWRRRRRGT